VCGDATRSGGTLCMTGDGLLAPQDDIRPHYQTQKSGDKATPLFLI